MRIVLHARGGGPPPLRALVLGVFLGAGMLLPGSLHPQNPGGAAARLERGLDRFGRGAWREAAAEFRLCFQEAAEGAMRAEALYWTALAEMGAGEYEGALQSMDELVRLYPHSSWSYETPYHRGRAYYYLGRYEEGLIMLKSYADCIYPETLYLVARKYAALYWAGECLYSLGQWDLARDMFSLILEQYPQSVKYEAAFYRVALINQKKVEKELLALLKWSHEESLRTVEEYQRRERGYEQAIIAYQKRIAELLNQSGAGTGGEGGR